MSPKRTAAGLLGGLTILASTAAMAAGPVPATPPLDAAPVADADLADMSGGQATPSSVVSMVLTQQNLSANNTGNSVYAGGNMVTGDVNLGAGSFQGFAGIGNFVINTGHNNNLLGSLSVSINMAPGGGS